jgi:cholest-4-en-3-one 26-monooxygenase
MLLDDDGARLSLSTAAAIHLTDDVRIGREGYPWESWDELRREAPVFWVEPSEDIAPFWSIARHADILTISKRPDVFISSERLRLAPRPLEERMRAVRAARTAEWGSANGAPMSFNDMDAPDHLKYRNLTSKRFTPRAMAAFEDTLTRLATTHVGKFVERLQSDGSSAAGIDIVQELAVKVPTAAIFEMLGVPESKHAELFSLWETNLNRFSGDSEPERGRSEIAEVFFHPEGRGQRYLVEMIDTARARGDSADDLMGVLLAARVDGEPLPQVALVAYVTLLIAAGLDTTRHATTGGVHALLSHPDQLALLVDDPSLLESAIEEILRFTSPVIHFMRTAVSDFEIGGQTIRAGESVALWYPSANRDEAVFDRAYEFDIRRDPNPHLAFGGYGSHFCIGAHFARAQLRVVFRELLELLPQLEIAGDLVRMRNLHVGGYMALPVREKAA